MSLIEIRTTYRDLFPAWMVLQNLSQMDLNGRTGSRVRTLVKTTKPHIEAREEQLNSILDQCGALKTLGGKGWKRDGNGDLEFRNKADKKRALAELEALADTEVAFHALPLEIAWFDDQPPQRIRTADGITYVPFGIKPVELDALAEAGVLVGMDDVETPDIEPAEPEATGTDGVSR